MKVKMLSWMSDDLYAKWIYRENTGKSLNLQDPQTFDEKLWWLKINYRIPLMTLCSDKVAVARYLESLGLNSLINKRYGVYDGVDQIPFDEMKGKYFIKCNHVSGVNMIYDSADSNSFNFKKFKALFNRALKQNYYLQSREWNYKNIEPKIIVEECLSTENLLDYKFFCFHGKVHLLMIDKDVIDNEGLHSINYLSNFYDRDFNFFELSINHSSSFDPKLAPKPDNYEEMLQIVEKISQPFPFCRVDLYNIDGDIRFGEITFFNEGGKQIFSDPDFDLYLGSLINISYINVGYVQ